MSKQKQDQMTLEQLIKLHDIIQQLTEEEQEDLLEFTRLLQISEEKAKEYAFEKHGYTFE